MNTILSKGEQKMKIKVIIEDGKAKSNLILEGADYYSAIQRIENFVKASYQIDETGVEDRFIPEHVPAWISEYDIDDLSQKDKLRIILERHHQGEWVKSQHIKEEYQKIWGDEIKLSSLSTYLMRFYEEGQMERKGSRAQREYRLPQGIKI